MPLPGNIITPPPDFIFFFKGKKEEPLFALKDPSEGSKLASAWPMWVPTERKNLSPVGLNPFLQPGKRKGKAGGRFLVFVSGSVVLLRPCFLQDCAGVSMTAASK